eukprot:gnl/MRDRNA2_/MRDRNA2_119171_c0_seq1.p1 gnl/MRDRNA2_/MRDRNA2_119171_c0~~gnl/MRDRNA2_/MRDRNA2_119171_c0_seq1.p1  ORF type:complete len:199 (-),score=21.07 gnl/MRDRNA2_/MRDRNA2_119171_c0_seq1:172-768(-)
MDTPRTPRWMETRESKHTAWPALTTPDHKRPASGLFHQTAKGLVENLRFDGRHLDARNGQAALAHATHPYMTSTFGYQNRTKPFEEPQHKAIVGYQGAVRGQIAENIFGERFAEDFRNSANACTLRPTDRQSKEQQRLRERFHHTALDANATRKCHHMGRCQHGMASWRNPAKTAFARILDDHSLPTQSKVHNDLPGH